MVGWGDGSLSHAALAAVFLPARAGCCPPAASEGRWAVSPREVASPLPPLLVLHSSSSGWPASASSRSWKATQGRLTPPEDEVLPSKLLCDLHRLLHLRQEGGANRMAAWRSACEVSLGISVNGPGCPWHAPGSPRRSSSAVRTGPSPCTAGGASLAPPHVQTPWRWGLGERAPGVRRGASRCRVGVCAALPLGAACTPPAAALHRPHASLASTATHWSPLHACTSDA